MARKTTTWPLSIATFDRLPKAAREALAQSRFLGSVRASNGVRIARAPAAVMVARIAAADALLSYGNNGVEKRPVEITRDQLDDILLGRT